MAKKKNNKNSKAAHKEVKSTSEVNMKEKVEVKQPISKSQDRVSRIVGSAFIGLGVLLVAFGVYSFIRFREEPTLDANLEAPVLSEVTSLTNGDRVIVRGQALGYDNVFVYVNDEKMESVKVNREGIFEYEYVVSSEGDYKIDVAGVKGFPNRNISVRSSAKTSVIDWSAPDVDTVTFKYGEETNKETFTLIGTGEVDATVTVQRGVATYEGMIDGEGNFRIEDIPLDEGKNVFGVSIKDLAGNEADLDTKIRVTYSPSGSVNGDAVVDENIPQAAGEFDALFGNQLMSLFALIALVAFSSTSAFLYYKRK